MKASPMKILQRCIYVVICYLPDNFILLPLLQFLSRNNNIKLNSCCFQTKFQYSKACSICGFLVFIQNIFINFNYETAKWKSTTNYLLESIQIKHDVDMVNATINAKQISVTNVEMASTPLIIIYIPRFFINNANKIIYCKARKYLRNSSANPFVCNNKINAPSARGREQGSKIR